MTKTALVTGANGGIGIAIVHTLINQGFEVIACYHKSHDALTKLRSSHPKERLILVQANLQNVYQVANSFDAYRNMDVLIHAACPPINYQALQKETWKSFESLMNVSIGSFIELLHIILPHMQKQRWGRIIAISSALALNVPPNKLSAYVTAKSALIGLCKSLAVEMAAYGITVNSIAPGVTQTKFLDTFPPLMKELVLQKIPLKKLGQPEDISALVGCLVSEQANYITGIDIPVAGGMVM